jgi:hypothetical protein
MRLGSLSTHIHERHENGESYETIGNDLGINKTAAWQIEHGYKPGKKLSTILKLDAEPNLNYTRSRRERLDEIARGLGYKSWSEFETYLLHNATAATILTQKLEGET